MLRDRLVVGVNDVVLQRRLLAEPRLTLKKKATEIAMAHETAVKDAKAIQGANGSPQAVNQITDVKPTTANTTKPTCHRCGKSNHKAQDCRAFDKIFSLDQIGSGQVTGEPLHFLTAPTMFNIVMLLCFKCQHPVLHEQYWPMLF